MISISDFKDLTLCMDDEEYTVQVKGFVIHEKVKGARYQTLFVVDKHGRLQGVLGEGDINKIRLDEMAKIVDVMNARPKFVVQANSNVQAKKVFGDIPGIRVIPVVDDDKKILRLISRYEEKVYNLPFTMDEVESILSKYESIGDWHYRSYAFNWGGTLDSRKFILSFLTEIVSKNAKVMDVACGTGLMCFYLAELGFNNLHGFDYVDDNVSAANELAELKGYSINFFIDDVLSPTSDYSDVDVAIFLGLVGCAGGFNKGFDDSAPTHMMVDKLLSTYPFKAGSYVFLDVYDDLSNYSLDKIKPAYRTFKYEDLKIIFEKHGYEIIDKCYDCSYKIKIVYVLKKMY